MNRIVFINFKFMLLLFFLTVDDRNSTTNMKNCKDAFSLLNRTEKLPESCNFSAQCPGTGVSEEMREACSLATECCKYLSYLSICDTFHFSLYTEKSD